MPLWLDHFLKGGPPLPATPQSELVLHQEPSLRVRPDAAALPVARCDIYYSIDPDPRARFWRSAEVTRDGVDFVASLPLHHHDSPLFAFANVFHTLTKPESLAPLGGFPKPVTEVCISSLLQSYSREAIGKAKPALTLQPSRLIDDFRHGLRDWYVLNAGNLSYQQCWTRKITDPVWAGPPGAKLSLTLRMPETNRLSIVLLQNEWRSYRGPKKTFVCEREIAGAAQAQTLILSPADFTSPQGSPDHWAQLDQLGLCAGYALDAGQAPSWKGAAYELLRVEWV